MGRPTRGRRRGKLGRIRRWLIVLAIGAMGLLYYRPVQAYLDTKHTLAARTAEVGQLAARKESLQRQLELTQKGVNLVQAARRLGLVRPGERLFIVKNIATWRQARAAHRPR